MLPNHSIFSDKINNECAASFQTLEVTCLPLGGKCGQQSKASLMTLQQHFANRRSCRQSCVRPGKGDNSLDRSM